MELTHDFSTSILEAVVSRQCVLTADWADRLDERGGASSAELKAALAKHNLE